VKRSKRAAVARHEGLDVGEAAGAEALAFERHRGSEHDRRDEARRVRERRSDPAVAQLAAIERV
jgi:hypothetical protein